MTRLWPVAAQISNFAFQPKRTFTEKRDTLTPYLSDAGAMDRLNGWVTLLTNLAVLAGLVVLIYEVNQNTQALQNETDVAVYSLASDANRLVIEHPRLKELLLEARTIGWNEFSDTDKVTVGYFWGGELNRLELQFRLITRNNDDLDNIVFQEQFLGLRSFQDFWISIRPRYEPRFVAFVDRLIAAAG
jgi:hypothetical protein